MISNLPTIKLPSSTPFVQRSSLLARDGMHGLVVIEAEMFEDERMRIVVNPATSDKVIDALKAALDEIHWAQSRRRYIQDLMAQVIEAQKPGGGV